MARNICQRICLEGELVTEGPISVGGAETRIGSDAPVVRDGSDRPFIPGSSLTGALRHFLVRTLFEGAEHLADPFFGRMAVYERDGSGKQTKFHKGFASRIRVHDATLSSEMPAEIRDHVRIERERGVADQGGKFDREMLPAGAVFSFKLVAESECDSDAVLAGADRSLTDVVSAIEAALANGWVRLGGAVSRGYGAVRLQNARRVADDLGSSIGALARLDRLAGRSPGLQGETGPSAAADGPWSSESIAPNTLRFEIHWTSVLPTFVKSGVDGLAVDQLPLVTRSRDGFVVPVIPGSSIKGVLRSQAERILRTVAPGHFEAGRSDGRTFSRLDGLLFGEAPEAAVTGADPFRGRASAVVVEDCLLIASPRALVDSANVSSDTQTSEGIGDSDRSIELKAWNRVISNVPDVPDGCKLTEARAWLGDAQSAERFRPTAHVAIDRWTGGAAENLLFSRLEPRPSLGEDPYVIRLELDLYRLSRTGPKQRHVGDAALALLLLTLRDLADGRLALGFGGNRGLGSIEVNKIGVRCGAGVEGWPEDLSSLFKGAKLPTALEPVQESWTSFLRPCGDVESRGGAAMTKKAAMLHRVEFTTDGAESLLELVTTYGAGCVGIAYTPAQAIFLDIRVEPRRTFFGMLRTRSGKLAISAAEQQFDLDALFELRFFCRAHELRWCRMGAGGRATLLSDAPVPVDNLKRASVSRCSAAPLASGPVHIEYLLWGDAVPKGSGERDRWIRRNEAQIGAISVPMTDGKSSNRLLAYEYRALGAHGNTVVIAERLAALVPDSK